MKCVLSSVVRDSGVIEYFQPREIDVATDPGITRHRQNAKIYSSYEEAALAIPAFVEVKHEQRKRYVKLLGWPITEARVLDPITIEVLEP